MMKKIAIIGCSGSGKSTLSRHLSGLIRIPVYHLDRLNWQPNWVATPREEWNVIQKELVQKKSWIIDGNYSRTLDIRLNEADTIIFLDFKRRICIYRVIKRFFKYRKSTRPDLNEGCQEKLDFKFLKWVWYYNRDQRPKVLGKLKDNKTTIIVLKSSKQVKEFLCNIRKNEM